MAKRYLSDICLGCFGNLDAHRFCFRCRKRSEDKPRSIQHLIPRTVLNNRYLIGTALGQGGFGITYVGWDLTSERKVAIKEFFPKEISVRSPKVKNFVQPTDIRFSMVFEQYKEMFMNEVSLLLATNHLDGCVRVFDTFEANNSFYMVMEFLDGINLQTYLLQRGGKTTLSNALMILLPIMESLKIIHQMGMIHRDISPENIIIIDNQWVKLIDFGAAMIYTSNVYKQLTQMKSGYAPLEQYSSNLKQGPWTDVFAIAATLYTCCTGVVPYDAVTRSQLDLLPPISRYGVMCAPVQEHALMKGLAIYSKDRYQNIGEFMEAIYGPSILMTRRDLFGNVIKNKNPYRPGP